jgi:hypothetical protein
MEKDLWGIGAFGAFLLLWYRRILIVKSIVGVALAVRKLIKRSPVMDIASLKSLVSVGAALGSVAGATMEDGKVDVKDLALLPRLIPVFPALLAIDFAQVVPEAKDLSEAEALELVALYKAEFDIPQDDVEVKIETVLSLCVRLSGIVAELIATFKKPAA